MTDGAFVVEARLPTAAATERLGASLAGLLRRGDVVVLTGPLGAGKTTLTRGLGAALDVRGGVSSPTFVLARTHPPLGDGPALVHVDAYRLADALELDDLDLDLDVSVTVIEWGRDVVDVLTDSWLDIELERPRADDGDTPRPADGADPEDDDHDVPRGVRVTAIGDRWRSPDTLAELRAAVAGAGDVDARD
ncbi:tRNA (adenosine(37)-N6)-threonylcarbamoyltransferase complex ATPase subunit type 1 TsaE [Pseudoclavibacter chungangensis]|uniref:tRNA threonylcarbamoyladenosine biosynthesis protein TsaE n=1 Tax=Pseudoclavibacter chungangensis TaxID=587635 RepID=A0A7J5C2C8_9MICO|nr:tRNA (adenosine(37)-N6)-threonylcarbamoyltransferase complex ATPase subunit type 1 TsaE [Pseudoclavibacter chungangensis]KAB1662330.1 tRNA (adenosine(37)-N6)-threonylcarbamoyltransferase complex ATPase subunit type 1 TsaE [Pseudoclavibacter chungangensis]NYJ65540.1 tRNA threonylcarbamoyl adenosine modification protein YjeE [Pseudoclavibacter chungangensis]